MCWTFATCFSVIGFGYGNMQFCVGGDFKGISCLSTQLFFLLIAFNILAQEVGF